MSRRTWYAPPITKSVVEPPPHIVKMVSVRCLDCQMVNGEIVATLEHVGIDVHGKTWNFRSVTKGVKIPPGLRSVELPEHYHHPISLSMPISPDAWVAIWANKFTKKSRSILLQAIDMLGEAFDYDESVETNHAEVVSDDYPNQIEIPDPYPQDLPAPRRYKKSKIRPVRITEMYNYYKDNHSLAQVGEKWGLSKQRIQQLFIKHGLKTKPRGYRTNS